MYNKLIFLLLLLATWSPAARAETDAPVSVQLTLTHVAPDKWRADYQFGEAIDSLRLGPPAGDYRKQAWHVATPGVALVQADGQELLRAEGKPISALSVDVALHVAYEQGNYTPFDRFSDGGTDLYVGFFDGEAVQHGRVRPLRLTLRLAGLAGETLIAPDVRNPGESGYAYFGPRKPVPAGVATLIVDPRTPEWMAAMLTQTTATISTFYDRAFQRPLGFSPLILVSIGDLDSPGLSIKGGVVGKQIVYRFEGKALAGGSPAVRQRSMELIAHEMAHIWQMNVARGGIGEREAWIHEGGAEAIALAALRQSGMFSHPEADAYAAKLIEECAALKGSVDSYRGMYACGFQRFTDYGKDIFALWKAMMETSEAGGAVYSTSMIDALRPRIGRALPAPE